MAESIVLIIKFDSIFQDSQLAQIWPQYTSVIKLAEQNIDILTSRASNGTKYIVNDIDGLKNALSKIDFLLSGHLLQVIFLTQFICLCHYHHHYHQYEIHCAILQNLIDSVSCYQTKGISHFSHQFHSYLRNTLQVVQKNINVPSHQIRSTSNSSTSYMFAGEDATDDTILTLIDEIILDPSNLAVKLNAMCILYHNLFGNLDQKLFASVIEINTKVCLVHCDFELLYVY